MDLSWKKKALLLIAAGVIGTLLALFMYAAPQKSRTMGTWFAPPSLTEFPSALMYTIWMTDLYQPTGIVATIYMLIYMGFAIILGVMMWKSLNLIKKEMTETDVVMLFMGLTAIPPLMGLAAAPLFGATSLGQGFAHLYHPRFFLILDWMFAALLFVFVAKYVVSSWEKLNLVRATIAAGAVVLLLLWMLAVYATQISHHELRNLMVQTPCPQESQQSIQIAHESAFSSLPFDVYARENGCNWVNFISTNMTPRMAAGGGFDALPASDVYFNKTLPANLDDYYYVYAAGTVPIDGVPEKIALEDGVELWFIKRDQTDRTGMQRKTWYDNSTETQYTRIDWSSTESPIVPTEVSIPPQNFSGAASSEINVFVNVTA